MLSIMIRCEALIHYSITSRYGVFTCGKHCFRMMRRCMNIVLNSRAELARNHGFTILCDIGISETKDPARDTLVGCWFDSVQI